MASETMRDAYTAAKEEGYDEGSVRYYGKSWAYASACMGQLVVIGFMLLGNVAFIGDRLRRRGQ